MRFLMIACLCVLMKAELPQAAKPYEEQGIKVEVSGELLLRYEKQSDNGAKQAPKGSQGNLSISAE